MPALRNRGGTYDRKGTTAAGQADPAIHRTGQHSDGRDGSKAQEDAGDRRDKALAKLTPQEREDMETVCLALAAMCKRKPA